jgi:predicted ABC-type ATPase
MRRLKSPRIIVIAGPNGAGKTTFAREFLPAEAACREFINADLIAAGLSPFAPEKAAIEAGRLMIRAVDTHIARRESFAFETTLAGRGYASRIPAWRSDGWRVELIFLGLPTAEMAIERVAQRVRQGGHSIPEDTIRRRFSAGRRLFGSLYQNLVDRWALYDNSGESPVLLDWGENMGPALQARQPDPQYGDARPGDLDMALEALRRAAQRAREIALQTGTDLVVVRDGRVVHISPRESVPFREPQA